MALFRAPPQRVSTAPPARADPSIGARPIPLIRQLIPRAAWSRMRLIHPLGGVSMTEPTKFEIFTDYV